MGSAASEALTGSYARAGPRNRWIRREVYASVADCHSPSTPANPRSGKRVNAITRLSAPNTGSTVACQVGTRS